VGGGRGGGGRGEGTARGGGASLLPPLRKVAINLINRSISLPQHIAKFP